MNCQIGYSPGPIVPVSAVYSPPGKGRIISLERYALGLELLRHQGKVRVYVCVCVQESEIHSYILPYILSYPVLFEENLPTAY